MATTDDERSSQLRSYRPQLSTDSVHALVRDLYGLHVLKCRELDSYDDRNFFVHVDSRPEAVSNDHLSELWPHGYVLKVLNSLDSKKPEVIAAKTTMTLTAAERGFPSPRPVPSVSGQLLVLHPLVRERQSDIDTDTDKDGEEKDIFLIRLMEFLPGTTLDSVTLTPSLSFQVGQYAARLDKVLKEVDDSNFPELIVNWNMQNVVSLRHLMCFIDDAEMVNVITQVIDAFETRVLKCEDGLQTGLIHSDMNDNNILVEAADKGDNSSSPPSMRVCGILDFGDATKSVLIVEIAVAMTYMTLLCPPDLDPDLMSGHALAGYLSEVPLTEAELELLPLTICARMCQTLTNGYHRRVLDPGNDYCLQHANKTWRHLQRLWTRPAKDTLTLWRGVASGHGVTGSWPGSPSNGINDLMKE